MKNFIKIFSFILLSFLLSKPVTVNAAVIPYTQINNVNQIENLPISYSYKWSFKGEEGDKEQKNVTTEPNTLNISEDSWLYIKSIIPGDADSSGNITIYGYSDSNLTNEAFRIVLNKGGKTPGNRYESYASFIEKGTYYIICVNSNIKETVSEYNQDIYVGAIPSRVICETEVKYNSKHTIATIKWNNKLKTFFNGICFKEGQIPLENLETEAWNKADNVDLDSSYQYAEYEVTENKYMSLKIFSKYNKVSSSYSTIVKVDQIDTKAPVISGIKKGKTYKKSAKITISDDISGIKKVKINGKNIKLSKLNKGYKIKKAGKYTIEAIDKAGHKRKISFKLKGKKIKKTTVKIVNNVTV